MAKKSTKKDLPKRIRVARIQNVRDVIVKRMKAQKVTAYGLAKLTGITEQTIRNFVVGANKMTSEKLGIVLNALGLEIRPKE